MIFRLLLYIILSACDSKKFFNTYILNSSGPCNSEAQSEVNLHFPTTRYWITRPGPPVLRWWDMILEHMRQKQTSEFCTAQAAKDLGSVRPQW